MEDRGELSKGPPKCLSGRRFICVLNCLNYYPLTVASFTYKICHITSLLSTNDGVSVDENLSSKTLGESLSQIFPELIVFPII